MQQATVIDFMRHGEPVGGRRYRGDGVDDPLSERGWSQMWRSVGTFRDWEAIVTSPLQRCRAFADSLAEQIGCRVQLEPRFREVGMGSWEGLSPQQILDTDPQSYSAFYRDPAANRPPGCESLDGFGARVAGAFESVMTAFAGRHVLVVAHAGVIRAATGYVLQASPAAWYRTRVDNASMTRFREDAYGRKLEFLNRPGVPEADQIKRATVRP
jgi:probable phosphoglycerate mutase